MDPVIPQFLMTMASSTAPQQAFEQADGLLVQAAQLKSEAAQLESQTNTINERAEILITTAAGLRAIAEQDRESIQYLLDTILETYQSDVAAYEAVPRKWARLQMVKTRVEDGMATIEELQALLEDMVTSTTPNRSERSLAPEPESPPSPLTTMPPFSPAGGKRGRSTSEGKEDQAEAPIKKVKKESAAGQEEDGIIQGWAEIGQATQHSESAHDRQSSSQSLSSPTTESVSEIDSLEEDHNSVKKARMRRRRRGKKQRKNTPSTK